jgi:hypothetical protein
MGDETKKVEYWSRQEYRNMDVHVDIDEVLLEKKGVLRCPLVGHVLYLKVKKGLRGPTCVFPNERASWGQRENDGNTENETDLVVVPAVQGRILRFPGNTMHSVPKPASRYMLTKQEEQLLRQNEEDDDNQDYNDDNHYDDDDTERSVLLFNTWPDNEPGPLGVGGDAATITLPEGIELCEQDATAYFEAQVAQSLQECDNKYGKNGEQVRCNQFHEWNVIDIHIAKHTSTKINTTEVLIPFMTKAKHKLCSQTYSAWKGPKIELQRALSSKKKINVIHLCRSTFVQHSTDCL